MRPGSAATSPALTRWSTAAASRPCTRSLPNEEVSNTPAASRTDRCSAADCSNQFGRPKEYSYSRLTPAGAYQLARSQPSSSPKTAPAGQEADRVEPGGDEAVAQSGGRAEVVETVRGKALRPAEMQPDSGVGQHRQPFHHVLVERPEVVPVLGQAGELRVGGDAAGGPRVTARLEEADHEPGALVLHVGEVRGGLDRRQAGAQAGDRLGDDVVVRERLARDDDAGQRPVLASRHAVGGDHVLGLDVTAIGGDDGDLPV